MKAFVLHQTNDLRFETVNDPQPESGEALVAVKAAGICGSDIPRIYRTGAYSYPLIPGHEFSGTVVKTGPMTDKKWLGQRVGVFPLIPCGQCLPCQKKQYEMCRHYSYTGSRRDGGFAELVAVPAANLLPLPEQVSFEQAAMLEPMAVAVHALRRVAPVHSQTVAICGLGTIGLLLLMFLLESRQGGGNADGAGKVLVIGNKQFQKQMVLNMGVAAECYCDAGTDDVAGWLMEHTDGCGVDVFFECVGKNETLVQAVEAAAPSGRLMLVGNPYTDMTLEKNSYWKILRSQLTVMGTWNSSFTHEEDDDWHYVLERLAAGTIRPEQIISHRFRLEDLEQGFHIMRDKTQEFIKVMGLSGETGRNA